MSGMARATTYTFDVGLLEHDYYYTYGIDWELPEGEVIEGFSLSFDQISNWDDTPNVLYVHLLEGAPTGLTSGLEGSDIVDNNYFDYYTDTNIHLVTWHNISSTPQRISAMTLILSRRPLS